MSDRSEGRDPAGDGLDDPRWDALARGDISAEDRAALEALAAEDPLAREALALFAPLGREAEARYAERIEAEIGAAKRAASKRRARVIRLALPLAAALAAAASLALFLRGSPVDPSLPAYALAITGGAADQRGDDPRSPRAPLALSEGSRFTITLRPETPASGPLAARAFLVRDALVSPLDVSVSTSPDGALRLVGQLGAVSPGDAKIVIVVGRPPSMPSAPFDRRSIEPRGGERQILEAPVRVTPN